MFGRVLQGRVARKKKKKKRREEEKKLECRYLGVREVTKWLPWSVHCPLRSIMKRWGLLLITHPIVASQAVRGEKKEKKKRKKKKKKKKKREDVVMVIRGGLRVVQLPLKSTLLG